MSAKSLKSLAAISLALTLSFMFFMRLVWVQNRKPTLGPSCNGLKALTTLAQNDICSGSDNNEFLERLKDWRDIPEVIACSEEKTFVSLLSLRLAYRCRSDQLVDSVVFMDQLALYFAGVSFWMILCRVWSLGWFISLMAGTMLMSRGNLLTFLARVDDWVETNVCIAVFFLLSSAFLKYRLSLVPLAIMGCLELLQDVKLGWLTGAFFFMLLPYNKKAFGSRQSIVLTVLALFQFIAPTIHFFPRAAYSLSDFSRLVSNTDLHWQMSLLAILAFILSRRGRRLASWQARCFWHQSVAILVAFVAATATGQMVYFDRTSPDIVAPFPLEPAILVMGLLALIGLVSPRLAFGPVLSD